jgi:UDPglucose 6-dehydrogenase
LKRLRVSIVGLGYVGLSTGVCLASRGIEVHGVDVDQAKLRFIAEGRAPFEEEGLQALLRSSLKKGLFIPEADLRKAVRGSEMTFLTVGTPSGPDGSIQLSHLRSAAEEVGRELADKGGYHHVVVKSTVVPGTTQGLVKETLERSSSKKCGEGFGLAANPEFLREGSAVADTFRPDAVVIGALDRRTGSALVSLYRRFYGKLPRVLSTSPANAELIKYASNTFRATQLSFLNTLANLCSSIGGADIDEVARGLSSIMAVDPRYLKAGLGFGGSCLPKDLRAMVAYSKGAGADPAVFEAVLGVNEMQPAVAVRMARDLVGGLEKKKVAVLGLAFKPNTDDVRESVAVLLVERLLNEGARVTACDPKAVENARRVLGDRVVYTESARECLRDSDCCIVATGWPEFARLKPSEFKTLMRDPAVVDARRILDAEALRAGGVRCATLGSGPSQESV